MGSIFITEREARPDRSDILRPASLGDLVNPAFAVALVILSMLVRCAKMA